MNHSNDIDNLKIQRSGQVSRENQVQQEAITLLVDTLASKDEQAEVLKNKENSDKTKQIYIDKSTGTPLNPQDADLETGINLKIKDVIDNYNQVMAYLTRYETLKRALQTVQKYNMYCKTNRIDYSYDPGYLELVKLAGGVEQLEHDIRFEQHAVVVIYRETCKRYFSDLRTIPNKYLDSGYKRYEYVKSKQGNLTTQDLTKIAKAQAKKVYENLKDSQIKDSVSDTISGLSDSLNDGKQILGTYRMVLNTTLKGINTLSDKLSNKKADKQNSYYRETWRHLGDRDEKTVGEFITRLFESKTPLKRAVSTSNTIFGKFDDYIEWKRSALEGIDVDENAVREISFYVSRLNNIFYNQNAMQSLTPFNRKGIQLEETLGNIIFNGETLAFQADESWQCYNFFIKSEVVVLGWMLLRRLYRKYNGYSQYKTTIPDIQNAQILRAWEYCCYRLGLSQEDFRMIVDENIKTQKQFNRKQLSTYKNKR